MSFAGGMLAVMLIISIAFRLPILFPAPDSAAFVGIHYLLPLLGLAGWGLCISLTRDAQRIQALLIAIPCYAIILWVHFNIKLWAPHINPTTYDAVYWSIDQKLRPAVDLCFAVRRSLHCILPYCVNIYMYAFILLFYVSFFFHSMHTPHVMRRLFRAVLMLQGLSAIAYLAFPALGPFIYEDGVNAFARIGQQYMLDVHFKSVQGGAEWLRANGSRAFVAGLGAMPSLHVGDSFLFLWFAARYARILLPAYILTFGYVCVVAIANRWHYLVDLPCGIALAGLCIYLADRLEGSVAAADQPLRHAIWGRITWRPHMAPRSPPDLVGLGAGQPSSS